MPFALGARVNKANANTTLNRFNLFNIL